jgi:hypothetical protein
MISRPRGGAKVARSCAPSALLRGSACGEASPVNFKIGTAHYYAIALSLRYTASKQVLRGFGAPDLAQLDHQAEGVVNGSSIAEGLVDIRVQKHEVSAGVEAFRVLAAHASLEQLAEIIFRAQIVVQLILGCFHRLFFLLPSGFEH